MKKWEKANFLAENRKINGQYYILFIMNFMNGFIDKATSLLNTFAPNRFHSPYNRECINAGIDACIDFSRMAIVGILSQYSIQPDSLKASIRNALLRASLTRNDIGNIAVVFSSARLREYFIKWLQSNPMAIKNLKRIEEMDLAQKIFQDTSRQVLKSSTSIREWLLSLDEKPTTFVSQSGGFVSGGIYFTTFGIFLPGSTTPILFPGMTVPILAKQLHEYSGRVILGEDDMSAIFQITKVDKNQNITNKFYNRNSVEITFTDARGTTYKVIGITDNRIVRAREIINGQPSKNLREHKLLFISGRFTLQDNT